MAGKNILIADAEQKTLIKLQELLAGLDVDVSLASDGAQALELALSVRQDMFIFADRLTVIDTPKLAEILRANPRTAAVPLVLLRNEVGAAAYGDGSLAKPVHKEALVAAVLRHAFRVASGKETGERLSGLLGEIPMADLLQVMRANRREGTLEITGSHSGSIWVRKGDVVDARSGRAEGVKALFRLLDAKEGKFQFKAGRVARPATIEMSLDQALLEAWHQRDEIERICRERPLTGRLVVLREMTALPEGLHPVHRELLLLVEFYGSVDEVVANAKVTDYEAHVGLRSLVDAGLIGTSGEAAAPRSGASHFRFEPALAVHMRHVAQHSSRRSRPLRVVVFTSAASVLGPIQAMFIDSRWVRNPDRVLGNRMQIALDGEFQLHLDFYPPGRQYAPLFGVPQGLLCGAVVLTNAADDKELDFLNESAEWFQQKGLPVEYVYHGNDPSAADWVRKAFGVAGAAEVHAARQDDFRAFLDAVRSVLVRQAAATGWSVAAR